MSLSGARRSRDGSGRRGGKQHGRRSHRQNEVGANLEALVRAAFSAASARSTARSRRSGELRLGLSISIDAATAKAVNHRQIEHGLAGRAGQPLNIDTQILLEDLMLGDAVLTSTGRLSPIRQS